MRICFFSFPFSHLNLNCFCQTSLSLQNSPNNMAGMNNPPGTPRDDGEMGGNFLNPFQSESVSRFWPKPRDLLLPSPANHIHYGPKVWSQSRLEKKNKYFYFKIKLYFYSANIFIKSNNKYIVKKKIHKNIKHHNRF